MGGKTGTTQNQSDGWFMSFTPSIVAGCWVGGEDRSIHFDRMAYGQGASMALPIHGLFYQKIYADPTLNMSDNGVFEVPPQYKNPCSGTQGYSPEYNEELIKAKESTICSISRSETHTPSIIFLTCGHKIHYYEV